MRSWVLMVTKAATAAFLVGAPLAACTSSDDNSAAEGEFVADLDDPKYQLDGETNINLTVEDFRRDISKMPSDLLSPLCQQVSDFEDRTNTDFFDWTWDEGYSEDQIVNLALAIAEICEERGL